MSTIRWNWILVLLLALNSAAQLVRTELIRDLRSPHAVVRRHAAAKLGREGAVEAIPHLLKALADSDAGVRASAARALGQTKDKRATPSLVKALGDTDDRVRTYAAYALGEIRDSAAARGLIAALRDRCWTVRDQAAWALRELHDPGLAQEIASLLDAPGADVDHVVWILRHLSPEDAREAFVRMVNAKDTATRREGVRLLAEKVTPKTLPHLFAALGDTDADVRLLAVQALADSPDDSMTTPLEALIGDEKDERVLSAARMALDRLLRSKGIGAYWSFDDGSTTVATDVTGWGADGKILGAKPVRGKRGKALHFDGEGYVSLGKPGDLNIGNQPFAVTAWIKPEAGTGVVVARGGAWCGYSLHLKDGFPAFGIQRVRDGPTHIATSEEKIPLNVWTHLTGVVEEKRLQLFVNGVLAASAKTSGFVPGNTGQEMVIGFDTGNSPVGVMDHFVGIIDEVRAHDVALTSEKIKEQYNADK
ncbi:MAG: hypothetical protein HOJ57_37090 [Lentisphaerae bacterium]|nr:hypothetical protein [Lentisphaerota bacterium]MBT4815909.1 hypothetical protein [Lentisphaerota bacterium]MBT5611616.1 hypothetical protein [Lentisphaerota bacterium]MBT7061715.1 hypothetical protein [Lentisphaerota bacterium]